MVASRTKFYPVPSVDSCRTLPQMTIRVISIVVALLVTVKVAHGEALARVQGSPQSLATLGEDLWRDRGKLIRGIEHNLLFLSSNAGQDAYHRAHSAGVELQRVQLSLSRLLDLLIVSENPHELGLQIEREFQLYRSRGSDGDGRVVFTGYFQPRFRASRVRTQEFRFPIYQVPQDFKYWSKPHPSRVALEGYDGQGIDSSPALGAEMAWLSQRYDVFMIHLQGSAQLEFTDGTVQSVGFAAGTDYPFRGISQNFLDHHQVAWQNLPSFFERRPQLLDEVLSRNNRFIFFKRYGGGQPLGSIGVPVIPERSIATDKDCLPPGAIGLINASLPQRAESGSLVLRPTMRIVLDQDTGSAIRGPGRVDIFMGSGEEARKMANMVYTSGSLYYLLLKA